MSSYKIDNIIILTIIIIIVIIMLYLYYNEKQKIESLHLIGYNICSSINVVYPKYRIKITNKNVTRTTFKNKKIVMKIIIKDKDGNDYDKDTIILAYLHELTHILVYPRESHDNHFWHFYEILEKSAIELKYITAESKIEKKYPIK